jgi:hypothetical protein
MMPEFIIIVADYEIAVARRMNRLLKAKALVDDVPWSLSHLYYANMEDVSFELGKSNTRNAGTQTVNPDGNPSDLKEEIEVKTDENAGGHQTKTRWPPQSG